MSKYVFISYSSKDRLTVEAIVNHFEGKGIRCWYADRDIAVGQDWASSIIAAIEHASVFVLVFTDFSNASSQVLREVNTAVNCNLPILSFRLTQNMLSDGMKYYLGTVHWLDAIDEELENSIDILYNTSKLLLCGNKIEDKSINKSPSPPKYGKLLVILVVLAAVIGLSVHFVFPLFAARVGTVDAINETGIPSVGSIIDPINLIGFINSTDVVAADNTPILPDNWNFNLDSTSVNTESGNIGYTYVAQEPVSMPDGMNLQGIRFNVDANSKLIASCEYLTDASFEACLNVLDNFDVFIGCSACKTETPENTVLEEYTFSELRSIFAAGDLRSDVQCVFISESGDSVTISQKADDLFSSVIVFNRYRNS